MGCLEAGVTLGLHVSQSRPPLMQFTSIYLLHTLCEVGRYWTPTTCLCGSLYHVDSHRGAANGENALAVP